MDIYMMGNDRSSFLNQWRESPEYKGICIQQKKECDRLAHIAQQLYASLDDIIVSVEQAMARTEFASGGNIHRGVYCPSPILDIIIGNVSRGRILKRTTTSDKACYQYLFDSNGSLLASKILGTNMPDTIEYIVHQSDRIYGLTVDPYYGPTYISEESFSNQKLAYYRYANLIWEENRLGCLTLHSESYCYDDFGLKTSDWVDYQAVANSVVFWHYEFERNNGYLVTFKAVEKPFDQNQELLSSLPTYIIRRKRRS